MIGRSRIEAEEPATDHRIQSAAFAPLPDAGAKGDQSTDNRELLQLKLRRKRGRALMAQLNTGNHYHQLLAFADSRLKRIELDPNARADLVHDAIHAVLRGLEGREGRRPRGQDLLDMTSFLTYLKQVIQSLVSNMGRHQRCVVISSLNGEVYNNSAADLLVRTDSASVADKEPKIRDLRRELFRLLCQRAPRRLHGMIKEWKRDFLWADAIPLCGEHRQYRAELRAVASQILQEIEPSLSPTRKPNAST